MTLHRNRFLFDHIPRTGGTYFTEFLSQAVGKASENFDCGPDFPEANADMIRELSRYPVVAGHLRLETVKAFRLLQPRRVVSMVRDPVAMIASTYKFWRYNIKEDLPHCNLAKELPFGDFIREPAVRMTVDNQIARHMFSLWDLDRVDHSHSTIAMAVGMAESYAFIGVTERMEDSKRAFARLFCNGKLPRRRVSHKNESDGDVAVSRPDRDYLVELNAVDYAIYRHVNEALDRILYLSPRMTGSASDDEPTTLIDRLRNVFLS